MTKYDEVKAKLSTKLAILPDDDTSPIYLSQEDFETIVRSTPIVNRSAADQIAGQEQTLGNSCFYLNKHKVQWTRDPEKL